METRKIFTVQDRETECFLSDADGWTKDLHRATWFADKPEVTYRERILVIVLNDGKLNEVFFEEGN